MNATPPRPDDEPGDPLDDSLKGVPPADPKDIPKDQGDAGAPEAEGQGSDAD